ncbi:hypothetical protein [Flavobacterium orientale]|uniref:Uncharacterized protein n=1 Tax=Flavobacterium orientale TaxID=1756020 RepID=A0A916XVG2_9FLAO|nr:hypothetical protein [Flavobacterium orientale]GGD14642.1 hypothetical protein GCM10011343_02120 [Flavobacterium orientale]
MRTKHFIYLFVSVFFVLSCSEENGNTLNQFTNQTITGYTFVTESIYQDNPDIQSYKKINTGTVVNNKITTVTSETFFNGISNGVNLAYEYIYDNSGRIQSHIIYGGPEIDVKYDFFYENNLVVAMDKHFLGGVLNYRVVNPSQNVVYFEKLTESHLNPAAQALFRHIVHFDQNQNIIKAGRDNNFDGVMDNENNFVYQNNNLISAQFPDVTTTYEYSPIINTDSFLHLSSFGKLNYLVMCAEQFSTPNYNSSYFNTESYGRSNINFNLSVGQSLEGTITVNNQNFIQSKVKTTQISTEEFNGQNTETTTYFFE